MKKKGGGGGKKKERDQKKKGRASWELWKQWVKAKLEELEKETGNFLFISLKG